MQFGDQPTRALGALLPASDLEQAVAEEVGPFRERIYPPLTTLALCVDRALSPGVAYQDVVARRLSERTARGEAPCSLNTGPFSKACGRLRLGLIRRLALLLGRRLEQGAPGTWRWRGRAVKLVDGTTLSMPDTVSNQAAYPQSGVQQPGLGFPLAMLVGVFSLATGALLTWATGPCRGKHTGEQALLRQLMPALDAGDILLADCYHCTYFTVAQLQARGIDLVTRQHQRRKTDFRRGHRLGPRDHVVEWLRPSRPSWMDAQTYATMPERLLLRETACGGRVLVTTLTDPKLVSPRDIADLYDCRWQVEVDLRSIKAVMGMAILRSRSAPMIDKEIAIALLAYNLICALMVRAAAGSGCPARALRFKGTIQLYLAYAQQLRIAGGAHAKTMIAHLLGGISSMRLRVRPGRVEPHAIKRRPTQHKLLTVPRDVARAKIRTARAKWA